MADGQCRVAVACEDDLALLSELEAALYGSDRLCEYGTVSRAAAAADGTTAAMEQGQIDVMRFRPLGDASCAECRARVAEVGPASFEESE